jgi:RNA polymerase sigma-70 factor (ECF subfamily)
MTSASSAAGELLKACLETGSVVAWTAFVQRFQPLIASSVSNVVRRYGSSNPSLIDDLVQESFLRLCRDNCRCLRDFHAQHEEAIFGYIKVIATSVALDHFRGRTTQKRRGEVDADAAGLEPSTSSASIENAVWLSQIESRLAATESERDRAIFWLYYREGYTAKDIASIPGIDLTQKGVESCIYRLTQLLRSILSETALKRGPVKGNAAANTLGVVE